MSLFQESAKNCNSGSATVVNHAQKQREELFYWESQEGYSK